VLASGAAVADRRTMIIRSSYDSTSATAGQAETIAPTVP
jgi:hypothetical protein